MLAPSPDFLQDLTSPPCFLRASCAPPMVLAQMQDQPMIQWTPAGGLLVSHCKMAYRRLFFGGQRMRVEQAPYLEKTLESIHFWICCQNNFF